ncbi:hypothetical protein [Kutzneria sp. NPDC052558]|uniref:hypothetical protein n=1 Tax=Kutzneria sp. NPDC052558 TaxID=3364121 RepID=UPI0037C7DE69
MGLVHVFPQPAEKVLHELAARSRESWSPERFGAITSIRRELPRWLEPGMPEYGAFHLITD